MDHQGQGHFSVCLSVLHFRIHGVYPRQHTGMSFEDRYLKAPLGKGYIYWFEFKLAMVSKFNDYTIKSHFLFITVKK